MISGTWALNKTFSLEPTPSEEEDQPLPHGKANVPFGWKREVVNGSVVYATPSNCLLWSMNDVRVYLMSDGTCKCGIECPLVLKKAFNFDPSVPSVMKNVLQDNNGTTLSTCNHHLLSHYHPHLSAQIIPSSYRHNGTMTHPDHLPSSNTATVGSMVHLISPVHFAASPQPGAVAVLHSAESASGTDGTAFLIPQQPVMINPSLNVHILQNNNQHISMMSHATSIATVNDQLATCSGVEIANYPDNY